MPTEVSAHHTIMLPGSVTQQNSTFIRFPIVALGAGDIEVLQRFLAATPAPSDIAFIIVTQRKPEEEPPLSRLLQPYTSLPVQQVDEATPLEQNHIYLIPPTHLLVGLDTHFHLTPRTTTIGRPVDRCFEALAHAVMLHKVAGPIGAVVLAGAGTDGAQGLTQIKAAGGVTACQAPLDRGKNTLLVDALTVDGVDWALPAEELPAKLVEYMQRAPLLPQPTPGSLAPEVEQSLAQILVDVQVRTGHDFSDYKPAWLLTKIEQRMQVLGELELSQYAKRLGHRAQEAQTLGQAWLNSTSRFFYPPEAFASFAHQILPTLFQAKAPQNPLRIWVAGCASGEEVYSLTILLLEYIAQWADPPELRVFATDVNTDALRKAREGLYPETMLANVSPERLARFFIQEAGRYRIKPEVRDYILFGEHNLLQDPPFAKLNLIVCRDLLSRLQSAVGNHLLELFHYLLQPNGYLWLGPQEEMARKELFQPVPPSDGHYRRQLAFTHSQPFPLVKQLTPRQPHLARPTKPVKRVTAYEELYTSQLEQYAPPGLLIDAAYNIVYYATNATLYLHQPSGETTDQVLKRVHPALREALGMGLYQVFKKNTIFQSQIIAVETDAGWRQVRVRVGPAALAAGPRFALVLFMPSEAAVNPQAEQQNEFDNAVDLLQAQLQTTQAEYEAAREEMTAVNEELMALNEELTIKTAELEYSKRELQSVNEELLALNQENRNNIAELRQLTANLQNLIVSTDIAALFLDNELQIRWFTPRTSEIFNLWAADEGRPLAHITHQLAYPGLIHDATAVLKTLTPYESEASSETGRWFFIRILPYRTVDQNVEGVVITFFDITARKRAEDALRQLNANLELRVEERTKELTRSNQELDQFAYIASHDLKSPLRAIHNLAQWIEEDAANVLPTESKAHLTKLHVRVKRMGKLVDDLLVYSRAGRHLHKPEWVDTARLVDDLRFFLAPPPGFRVESAGPLPTIYTERVPLETVLRNLIDNALKHHHQPGQGLLQISAQVQAEWTEFTISDNGPGIGPQYHERIFEVFQSLKPREEVEGSGMGLAVVKKAVESRGGWILLESTVGQGATFRFTWPKMKDER